MKKISLLLVFCLLMVSCITHSETQKVPVSFKAEMEVLKALFQVPGLAVSVEQQGEFIYEDYLGMADIEAQVPLNNETLFPIASITKTFSAVLLMKLVEAGKLSLDVPINSFLSTPSLPDSILVSHVLSHTSQGAVGQAFYYSARFSLLTKVIEKASGEDFATFMRNEIITPLKLDNTFLLKDEEQLSQLNRTVAQPYILEEGIQKGFIDYGYSTSAGLVSNLHDLAVFNRALDQNLLISEESKQRMFSSFQPGLAYGYGVFSQQYQGVEMVWAYGQYDCYSSLFLKIPSKGLSFTLMANNSLLSDPARLIYGDATSSLFVMSFLKHFVLQKEGMPLLETTDSIDMTTLQADVFYRDKVLTQALSDSFMARYDTGYMKLSTALLDAVFSAYPDYLEYADLNLLHNLTFLKSVAFYKELGEFNQFDEQIERIGEKLLSEAPDNPYALSYMAGFYDSKGETDSARNYYKRIVDAPNFTKNWYTREAQNWLLQH